MTREVKVSTEAVGLAHRHEVRGRRGPQICYGVCMAFSLFARLEIRQGKVDTPSWRLGFRAPQQKWALWMLTLGSAMDTVSQAAGLGTRCPS